MRTRKAIVRKLVSQAERALLEGETDRGHMDVIVELGFTLKHAIPKGDAFIEWIADEEQLAACIAALLSRHFTWEEIRVGFFDLTRWRWLPSVEQLQLVYANNQPSLASEVA